MISLGEINLSLNFQLELPGINLSNIVQTQDVYLRVTPVTVQWVSTSYPVEYVINSNTDWEVE